MLAHKSVVVSSDHAASAMDWQRIASEIWLPLEIRTSFEDFGTHADRVALPGGATVIRVRHESCDVMRSSRGIRRFDAGSMFLTVNFGESFNVTQGGRSVEVGAGSGSFYLSDSPYDLSFQGSTDVVVLQVPRAELSVSPARQKAVTARAIDAEDPVLALLTSYLHGMLGLPEDRVQFGAAVAQRIVVDLVSWLINEVARGERTTLSPHDALYQEIREFIEQTPEIGSVSPESLAKEFHVSRRTLYEIFARHGAAPRTAIRDEALRRAQTLLLDPSLSIADIAIRSGFASPASFSRAFRQQFEELPGAWRRSMNRVVAR